jgi:hypothetical protein
MEIDIDFNFKSDTPPGKDPDSFSPTLRKYHKFLWSRQLPGGAMFSLFETPPHYLHHKSGIGEFFLSSDSVIPTFRRYKRLSSLICQISQNELNAFHDISYTIGGMMIFPSNRINGMNTINADRGFNSKIRDRFDLTLECIRRHYCHEKSPLSETLVRYSDFFTIFENFRGYVDYFFLQDLVSKEYSSVKFFTPFDNFCSNILPSTVESYQSYRELSIEFIKARNDRIKKFFQAKAMFMCKQANLALNADG